MPESLPQFAGPAARPLYADEALELIDRVVKTVRRRRVGIDQAVEPESILQREQHRAGPRRIDACSSPGGARGGRDELGDQRPAGTQPLGQLGPVPLGGHPVRRPTFTLRGLESLPVVFAATEKER